jgi:hypothetical protein
MVAITCPGRQLIVLAWLQALDHEVALRVGTHLNWSGARFRIGTSFGYLNVGVGRRRPIIAVQDLAGQDGSNSGGRFGAEAFARTGGTGSGRTQCRLLWRSCRLLSQAAATRQPQS